MSSQSVSNIKNYSWYELDFFPLQSLKSNVNLPATLVISRIYWTAGAQMIFPSRLALDSHRKRPSIQQSPSAAGGTQGGSPSHGACLRPVSVWFQVSFTFYFLSLQWKKHSHKHLKFDSYFCQLMKSFFFNSPTSKYVFISGHSIRPDYISTWLTKLGTQNKAKHKFHAKCIQQKFPPLLLQFSRKMLGQMGICTPELGAWEESGQVLRRAVLNNNTSGAWARTASDFEYNKQTKSQGLAKGHLASSIHRQAARLVPHSLALPRPRAGTQGS